MSTSVAVRAFASVVALALAAAGAARAGEPEPWLGPGPAAWDGDLAPISAGDWSYDRAAHLLERAGFGGTPADVAELAAMTPEEAVGRLVDFESLDNGHLAPFDESGVFDPSMEPFARSRAEAVQIARETGASMGVKVKPDGDRPLQPVVNRYFYYLRSDMLEAHRVAQWWAQRMLATNRPLEEKMAFFWHGHFATSDAKVRDYRKMLNQLALFRAHGTGNFRDLLIGVAEDPAMLVYLDAGDNVKAHPNENFGREVLELFTMGIGNYTEQDIREAARAFTGWTNDGLDFVVDAAQHDDGPKTVLGRTGNFDGVDVLDIVLAHDATARFIAGKIYRFLVREEASPALLDELGRRFRAASYEINPLLRTIFLSKDFYGPAAYATQIKGPVQLAVSTYRKLEVKELPGVPDFNASTMRLGQKLLYPPNVAGWEGGRSWVTPATLVDRGNFLRQVLFPNLAEFRPPDRHLPEIYRKVGENIRQGADIISATIPAGSMTSMANEMVAAAEDYNTRYGVYRGWVEAFARVKPIPRDPAAIDLTAMVAAAGLETTEQVVDHFLTRLLRVPLAAADRQALIAFLDARLGSDRIDAAQSYLEEPLRLLVHLIMSTPEYQLG